MPNTDALIAALGGLTPAAGPIPVAAGTALAQPAGERLVPAMGAGIGSVLGATGGGIAGGLGGAGLGALGMGMYEKYRDMPWYEELLVGRDPAEAAAYGADIGAPIGALLGGVGGGAAGAYGGLNLGREGIEKQKQQQQALGQRDLMMKMLEMQGGGQQAPPPQQSASPQQSPSPGKSLDNDKEEKNSSHQGTSMDYEKIAAGMGAIARLNQQNIDHQQFYKAAMQSGDETLVALADAVNEVYKVSQHEKTAAAGQPSVIAQMEQIIFG